MTIDDLGKQMTEYQMRVEQVLNGMDGVLTRFDQRLTELEKRLGQLESRLPNGDVSDGAQRIAKLERQVTTLTTALHELIEELDHD